MNLNKPQQNFVLKYDVSLHSNQSRGPLFLTDGLTWVDISYFKTPLSTLQRFSLCGIIDLQIYKYVVHIVELIIISPLLNEKKDNFVSL